MKRILVLFFAAFVTSSCTFVKINGEKLSDLIRNGDIDITVNDGTASSSRKKIIASDNYVTKKCPVDVFTSIRTDIPCDIIYTDGEPSLTITCPDNVFEHVSVENNDGELAISLKRVPLTSIRKFEAVISAPMLKGLHIDAPGDFDAPRGIVTDSFCAVISGAGDMDIEGLKCGGIVSVTVNGAGDIDLEKVDCGFLKVNINGAGDCSVEGHSKEADFVVNGAGDVDIHEFTADNLRTSVNGIGNVRRK